MSLLRYVGAARFLCTSRSAGFAVACPIPWTGGVTWNSSGPGPPQRGTSIDHREPGLLDGPWQAVHDRAIRPRKVLRRFDIIDRGEAGFRLSADLGHRRQRRLRRLQPDQAGGERLRLHQEPGLLEARVQDQVGEGPEEGREGHPHQRTDRGRS